MALSVKSGTYTGNTTGQSITGLGFQPKLVMVREIVQTAGDDGGAQKFSSMPAGESFAIGSNSAALTDSITSIDADGFTLGASARVNALSVVYYWFALGGTDVTSSSYTGDGADGRSITGAGFAPLWVMIKGSQNSHGVHKMNSTGASTDISQFMTAVADTADLIQTLAADGFTVGTHANVNVSPNVYYWVAIKSSTQTKNASYTGDGVDDRSITGVGFSPNTVIIKGAGANSAAFRNASMSGDSSAQMENAGGANLTQALESDGFQVGTDARVNTNAVVYHYMAFNTAAASGTNLLSVLNAG